jgi:2-oxoglutarate ferredoxin oxidoreductase subunit beta
LWRARFPATKKQLLAILKAAISHRGTAMIDVISPCVTFNDHEGSTKSYSYVKDHEEMLGDVSFVPFFEDIAVEYEPGTTKEVTMHDGSRLLLSKLPADFDPSNPLHALRLLAESRHRGELLTGIFYVNSANKDFIELLNIIDEPLATLPLERVRPGRQALDELMEDLK